MYRQYLRHVHKEHLNSRRSHVHKPFNSLRWQLVHVKDKTETLKSAEQSITSIVNNLVKNSLAELLVY